MDGGERRVDGNRLFNFFSVLGLQHGHVLSELQRTWGINRSMWSFSSTGATRSTPQRSALPPARLKEIEGWTVGPNVNL
jgi:hypothetical protein